MTKIGSPTGGIRPPDFESNKPSAANPKIEAPISKTTLDHPVNPGSATEAKSIQNTQGELMKKKLEEGLKSSPNVGVAPGEKFSPSPHGGPGPHGRPAPVHPVIDLHITSAGAPNVLVNDQPAKRLEDEKKK